MSVSAVTPEGRTIAGRTAAGIPVTVAVDLGSEFFGIWASQRGRVGGPAGKTTRSVGTIVRRGRVVDPRSCVTVLENLIARFDEPVPPGGIVVAGRPVLTAAADQHALRAVLHEVLRPARVLFIDNVRAAAIGSGAAAGTLLMADIGAQLSEVALLSNGRTVAARRMEIGTRDLGRGAGLDAVATLIGNLVADLCRDGAGHAGLTTARARGLIVVGDGALHHGLTARLAETLGIPVHCAASPRTAALTGAKLAARAAMRHPPATPGRVRAPVPPA